MNHVSSFAPAAELDDIRTFMPGISEEEYAKRAKLRSIRNAATAMVSATESSSARKLAWMAIDYITEILFASAKLQALDDIDRLGTRLMLTAMQVEMIDQFGAGR